MYVIKRTVNKENGQLAYFKYDGWELFSNVPLDLTGVVLFTEGERKANTLRPNEEWQWYGAYKR